MKKFFIICLLFLGGQNTFLFADPLFFDVHFNDKEGTIPVGNKGPIVPVHADFDDDVITFTSSHAAYTLLLLDEDGEVVHSTYIPSNVNVVTLPSTLTGNFELRLDFGGSYYFFTEITL